MTRPLFPVPSPGRLPLLLLAGVGACKSDATTKDGATDAAPTDTGPTTPTDFTGFVPHAFGVDRATFAVDDQGRAVPYLTEDGLVPVTVSVLLADASIADGPPTAENSCHVTWRSEEPVPQAAWAAEVGAVAAWALPASADVEDDCGGLDFPPPWAEGPRAVLERWAFGVGLGELAPSVADQLPEWFGEDFENLAPFVAGGGYYWDGLTTLEPGQFPENAWPDGWVDTSVAYAYELEADFGVRLVNGLPVSIPAADLYGGGAPAVARYDLQATTLLTPGQLLVAD